MTRQQLIDNGNLWQVYPDASNTEILFEGTKTACFRYLQANNMMRRWKKGEIRTGNLIWEQP